MLKILSSPEFWLPVLICLFVAGLLTLWLSSRLKFSEIKKSNAKQNRRWRLSIETILTYRLLAWLTVAMYLIYQLYAFIVGNFHKITHTLTALRVTDSELQFTTVSLTIIAALGVFVFLLYLQDANARKGLYISFAKLIEALWLLGMNANHRKTYELHGRWRWQVLWRRLYRAYQHQRFWDALKQLRWLWMLIVTAATGMAVYGVWQTLDPNVKTALNLDTLAKQPSAPGLLSTVITVFGLGILFIIWLFRDQNNRWQIDNQRKDVNLKDFQKLAEWAAGMHLPEDELSTKNSEAANSKSEETTIKTSMSPSRATLTSNSRRDGAISLQIAAIYQLQAFLNGEFGKHFQRPAFQLLKSVWLAQMQSHAKAWGDEVWQAPLKNASTTEINNWRTSFHERRNAWQIAVDKTSNSSLVQALCNALLAEHGRTLRNHAADIPNMLLTGSNSHLPALQSPLELDSMNLTGIQLQGANLGTAHLQGTNLSDAQLQGSNLAFAHLQGANLRVAKLQGANLLLAKLQGANLQLAQLQGAYLLLAQLQGANLQLAQLQGADLQFAQLQDAVLVLDSIDAIDQSTKFSNVAINEQTVLCVGRIKDKLVYTAYKFPDDFDIDQVATEQLLAQCRKQGWPQ